MLFKAEKGGYKTYVMEIKGKRVYSKLKYESGVHRVQRVPQTETQGRVHTSTATVAIMPEVKHITYRSNSSLLCPNIGSVFVMSCGFYIRGIAKSEQKLGMSIL